MAEQPCRCEDVDELVGDDATSYADGHLVECWRHDSYERYGVGFGADGLPSTVRWLESLRGTGFGEWKCPITGWRFHESWTRDPSERRFRRRPFTTREDYLDRSVVMQRVEEVANSDRAIHETFEHRSESKDGYEAWHAATERGKRAREALYSPDLDELVAGIPRGDRQGIEAGILFLEIDPWTFRTGYMKEKVLARLARAALTAKDQERVRDALIAMLLKGPRRHTEFSVMLRLARHVRSDDLAERLRSLERNAEPSRARTLERVRKAVEGSRRAGRRRGRRGKTAQEAQRRPDDGDEATQPS